MQYCEQRRTALTEDDLRTVFAPFGQIIEVRIFKTQGYAFIRYATKEQAATVS